MDEWLRRLGDVGFVVMPGPVTVTELPRLSQAYDDAVTSAHPDDVSVRSSTRVRDFVNRGAAFDSLYVYEPVLAACCHLIGQSFKLSSWPR